MRSFRDPRAVALAATLAAAAPPAFADTVSSVLHVIITIAGDCTVDVETFRRNPDDPGAWSCTAPVQPIVSHGAGSPASPANPDGSAPVEVVTLSF